MLTRRKITTAASMLLTLILLITSNVLVFANTNAGEVTVSSSHPVTYEYIDGLEVATQVLSEESFTAQEMGAVVKFNRDETVEDLIRHLIKTQPTMSYDEAVVVANELADNFEVAELNVQNAVLQTVDTRKGVSASASTVAVVVPLGRIIDNSFIPVSSNPEGSLSINTDIEPLRYIPDTRTTIISEGWSVNPYQSNSILNATYLLAWYGLDNYKTSVGGTYTQSNTVSVSQSLGFNTGSELKASDALKFNLTVSGSMTATSSITQGFTLNVPGWNKVLVRPYIYWYNNYYTGTYRYYCHNFFDNTYFYVYETRSATNSYVTETSTRTWSRENTAKNPNATSPTPPTDWEW